MILIYTTCPDTKTAQSIGEQLLKKRLCGCINIIPEMRSTYWWPPKSNQFESANETILLIKTVQEKYKEVESEILKIHPSDTPCIFSFTASNISPKYDQWLKEEIK